MITYMISLDDGSDVNTVAIGIRKRQHLEVRIALGNLLEPLVARSAGCEGVNIIWRVNYDSSFVLAATPASAKRGTEIGVGAELDLSHWRSRRRSY